jgi:hypothetical protein
MKDRKFLESFVYTPYFILILIFLIYLFLMIVEAINVFYKTFVLYLKESYDLDIIFRNFFLRLINTVTFIIIVIIHNNQ